MTSFWSNQYKILLNKNCGYSKEIACGAYEWICAEHFRINPWRIFAWECNRVSGGMHKNISEEIYGKSSETPTV